VYLFARPRPAGPSFTLSLVTSNLALLISKLPFLSLVLLLVLWTLYPMIRVLISVTNYWFQVCIAGLFSYSFNASILMFNPFLKSMPMHEFRLPFSGSNICVSFLLSLYLSFGLALYLVYFMIQLTIFFYGIFRMCFLIGYFHLVYKVVSYSN